MRSRFSVASIFSAWFGILLCTGEAAGFCASVFENQQGIIDDFLCSQFKRNPINNNSDSISKSYHLLNIYTRYRLSFWNHLSRFWKKKKERERLKNVKCDALMWKTFCFLRVDHQETMRRIQHLWEVLPRVFKFIHNTKYVPFKDKHV